jgi:hypothetical protein
VKVVWGEAAAAVAVKVVLAGVVVVLQEMHY